MESSSENKREVGFEPGDEFRLRDEESGEEIWNCLAVGRKRMVAFCPKRMEFAWISLQAALEKASDDAAVISSPVPDEMFTTGEYLSSFIKKDAQRLTHFTPRFLRAMTQLGMRARNRISRIDVPVMILLGDHDEATDNAATLAAFGRMRHSAEIHMLRSAHGLQFDAGEDFSRHIIRFVQNHTGERDGHRA